MSLLGRLRIRHGKLGEEKELQQLTRQFPDELPFVMLPQLTRSIDRRSLLVAEVDGNVVGFVHWNARRDGWHTLYELVVDEAFHRSGVGRNLLYACPTPVRLRCTVDNDRANRFYENAGMRLVGTESGCKRMLNIWELKRLIVFCQGANELFSRVARESGMAYGARSDHPAANYPFMLDAPFKEKDWNWENHLNAVRTYRPVLTFTRDYGNEYATLSDVLEQIEALQSLGIPRVYVCPKKGASLWAIPKDCGIGISVKSVYEGYYPDFRGLHGRKVHLLGGTPQKWLKLIPKIEAYGGRVVSMDGSSHETASKVGSVWDKETLKWSNKGMKADYYNTMVTSCRRIVQAMNASDEIKQLVLF